jgi:hypothetical protein
MHTYTRQYDKYNVTRDLGLEEIAAEAAHMTDCVNKTLDKLAANSSTPVNFTLLRPTVTDDCLKSFEFKADGRIGCLRSGLGGPSSMNCYRAIRLPKFSSKPSPSVRCNECARWVPGPEILRYIAEEEVQAGSIIQLRFTRDRLALRAPIQGLARDSKSVSLFHNGDARNDVPERYKYRAGCRMPSIAPAEQNEKKCMPLTREHVIEVGSGTSIATVRYSNMTATGPTVVRARMLSFDSNRMNIFRGQEVASPVLELTYTPGVKFTRAASVDLAIEKSKMQWYLGYQAQKKLAALAASRRNGRTLMQQAQALADVDMLAVWYNNQTNRWTEFTTAVITEVMIYACTHTCMYFHC